MNPLHGWARYLSKERMNPLHGWASSLLIVNVSDLTVLTIDAYSHVYLMFLTNKKNELENIAVLIN